MCENQTYKEKFQMTRIFITIIILLITVNANAKDVTLVAGLSLPPYIIQESNSGMEYDIIKEALAQQGHNLTLHYVPFVRVAVDYKNFDGATTINESSGISGNYSDEVMTYRNYAISLKENGLKIDTIQDLKDKRIVAFQNASKYLGSEYNEVTKNNSKYSEQGNQSLQVKMLYSNRADAVVSDINIFKYYKKKTTDIDTSGEVVLHEIFPGVTYKVLFNDATIRDDFNKGLKSLRDSGRYDEIISSYVP